MLTRILTGICLALIAIPVGIFSHTFVLVAVVALLSAVGVFEMLRCLGLHKNYHLAVPSYIIAVVAPALTRFLNAFSENGLMLFAFFYLYAVYVLACAMFSRGKILFADAAKAVVSTAYIVCGFSCVVATRDLPNGMFLLIMVIVVAFATDIFAYFSGMLFGKHKLIPAVSPKKTVEGAIGGTLISAAAFVGCAMLYANIYEVGRPHVISLFVCGIALSFVSQVGDLVASFIKRERDVKDYGSLFPGHGGVLDRFDSVIAVAPVLYLLLSDSTFFTIFK
ncbi:MAG: phosphatidate cytidylyltransferase [Clostridia bacterium]|nr:phosphatidate cytidylyltransferase [Clostridia bacterium]